MVNRRNFIGGMLTALAGFSILPPAQTYGRVWRAERKPFFPLAVFVFRAGDGQLRTSRVKPSSNFAGCGFILHPGHALYSPIDKQWLQLSGDAEHLSVVTLDS